MCEVWESEKLATEEGEFLIKELEGVEEGALEFEPPFGDDGVGGCLRLGEFREDLE